MLLHSTKSLDLTAKGINSDFCGCEVGAVAVAFGAKRICFSFLFRKKFRVFSKLCIVFGNSTFAVFAFSLVCSSKLLTLVYIFSCSFVTTLVLFIGASEKLKTGMDIGNFFLG